MPTHGAAAPDVHSLGVRDAAPVGPPTLAG